MLDKLKKQKVGIFVNQLAEINEDLNETLENVSSLRLTSRLDDKRLNFESSLRQGNFKIVEIEGILDKISPEEFDKEILNKYIQERSIFDFRKEVLIDVFKESYKKLLK